MFRFTARRVLTSQHVAELTAHLGGHARLFGVLLLVCVVYRVVGADTSGDVWVAQMTITATGLTAATMAALWGAAAAARALAWRSTWLAVQGAAGPFGQTTQERHVRQVVREDAGRHGG